MPTPATSQSPTLPGPAHRVPLARSGLEIQLRSAPNGPVIAREPVIATDFQQILEEAWLEGVLRKGFMVGCSSEVEAGLLLIPDKNLPTRCQGYAVELPGADGGMTQTVFSFHSLADTARRAIARLAPPQNQEESPAYHFDLHVRPDGHTPPGQPEAPLLNASVTRRPLQYLSVPLAPLLAQAEASTPFPDLPLQRDPFPVFYPREVLRQAEEFSRKGAESNARFESGAVLAGCLCSCPDSGEFFVIVLAAFEVKEADQTLVSLAYSGESWTRIQTVIRARQKTQPFFRMIGQAHGHNFIPNEGQVCAECLSRPYCNVTNLFASADDQNWSRAVFSQQPWHLCHIFGLTARCDLIDGLFTLRDGRLSHRAYHVLPDFNPDQYPTLTASTGPLIP